MSSPRLNYLIDVAQAVFNDLRTFSNIKLPTPFDDRSDPINVSALWTKDGLRPRWDNLAAIASSIDDQNRLPWWERLLSDLSIPLGMLVSQNQYFILSRVAPDKVKTEHAEPDRLRQHLEQYRKSLFTPRSLGTLRSGQLSFADMEEEITEYSFSYLARGRTKLDESLERAIEEALKVEIEHESRKTVKSANTNLPHSLSAFNAVLMVTIAYLAARILEDKRFFGEQSVPTNDPVALLKRTVLDTNGFFNEAINSNLPWLSPPALQQMALYLGSSVTFALVDHIDVGRFYERALQMLQRILLKDVRDDTTQLDFDQVIAKTLPLINLQQYYTPVAIANRMLEHLPIERLRPEERLFFDPAAGSGSLLLSATRRLASMSDIPNGGSRGGYLADHVAGNDKDHTAKLVTKLRYVLIQESFGIKELFPMPSYYGGEDFTSFTKETLPFKPHIIIANPPFAEEQNVQRAANFVELVLSWMDQGDQFALILPNTFLSGSTHGISQARKSLTERCHLFEVWQLPEGVVGLAARQPVCIILGAFGKQPQRRTVAHAILSGARIDAPREKGFLGQAWLAQLSEDTNVWSSVLAPPIEIPVRTISLQEMYYVFIGVNLYKDFPPVGVLPEGVECKQYWRLGWRPPGRLWADPERVIPEERYIRYGKEFLERPRLKNAHLYDRPKILIGRSVNKNARDPLAAHYDDTGFCPNSDVYCICSLEMVGKPVDYLQVSTGWQELNEEDKLLWLLGILSSEIAKDITLGRRDSRHLPTTVVRNFELPAQVDYRIVELTRAIVNRDKRRETIPDRDPLREELHSTVEASYGYPERVSLTRTGPLPELKLREDEAAQHTVTVTGQVLDASPVKDEIYLYLDGIMDDVAESWVPLPPEMPGWALDGQVFSAELSNDIKTFSDLIRRPWALRSFKHTPRPYLTIDELKEKFSSANQG